MSEYFNYLLTKPFGVLEDFPQKAMIFMHIQYIVVRHPAKLISTFITINLIS